jgi:hypothetical protein
LFRRQGLTRKEVADLAKRDWEEEVELGKFIADEMGALSTEGLPTSSQPEIGRQTGTAEWKSARGEDGAGH